MYTGVKVILSLMKYLYFFFKSIETSMFTVPMFIIRFKFHVLKNIIGFVSEQFVM